MKTRLSIVAALTLPMMVYSLPTMAEDKSAGMPENLDFAGRLPDDARQAMAKECQNDDKAKKEECMKKFLSRETGLPTADITIED
jgi:hypothetical protein